MSKRHQSKREYSSISKCKAPACCSMRCCGNHFGIIGASNHVRNGNKKKIRRYFRHAMLQNIKLEVMAEVEYMLDEMLAYERMRDE